MPVARGLFGNDDQMANDDHPCSSRARPFAAFINHQKPTNICVLIIPFQVNAVSLTRGQTPEWRAVGVSPKRRLTRNTSPRFLSILSLMSKTPTAA